MSTQSNLDCHFRRQESQQRRQEALLQVRWRAEQATQEATELLAGNDPILSTSVHTPEELEHATAAAEATEALLLSMRQLRPALAHLQRCHHALEAHRDKQNEHEGVH